MEGKTDKIKIEVVKKWLGAGSINIFGLPFSGKDTHGHKLAEVLDGELVGGGRILRSKEGPQHIKDRISAGYMAPTDEYLEIVLPYLSKEKYAGKPLILSSIGRWHGEEPSVISTAQSSGHPMKAVIYLDISHQEVINRHRLSNSAEDRGQRHDDDEAVLEKRFAEFEEKTLPVINFYKQKGLLLEIDGSPSITNVSNEILNQLYILASSKP